MKAKQQHARADRPRVETEVNAGVQVERVELNVCAERARTISHEVEGICVHEHLR
jgi:hypothetical protein